MRCFHIWTTYYFNSLSSLVLNGFIYVRSANLRPLSVYQNTNVRRYRSHIFYDITNTIWCCVSGIHTNHIHTSEEKLLYEFRFAIAVTYRANNLSLFHCMLLNLCKVTDFFVITNYYDIELR